MMPLGSTASDLLARLVAREISAEEVVRAHLDRIDQLDGRLKAFLLVDAEGALAAARNIDARRARGAALGKLAGIPVAVKDVLCTRGLRTTCASRMLAQFVPPYDAHVIERLRAADAVLLGKTNMDEFAMGSSTENSAFQVTANPWDAMRVPGGSSGGSAAAVAASMATLALGSDTGGSIRQPAGLCGIVGLKPTYGRVSRYGLIAYASSLDQVGPMTRDARDAALLLEVIAGHDARDATCVERSVPAYSEALDQPVRGLRIGIVREHFGEGLDPEVAAAVEQAVDVLCRLGANVREVSLPYSKYAVAAYYLVAPSEASSNLARYDGIHFGYRTDEAKLRARVEAERDGRHGESAADADSLLVRLCRRSRAEGLGTEVKRRIMLGTYALSAGYYDAYYLKALKVRRLIRNDFDAAFREVDLLAGPVSPTPAFRIGEKTGDPLAMYLSDIYTISANLAGIPAISIPCGFSSTGLPIGLQLQAAPFAEELLLRAAHHYQGETDWHTRRPYL